MGKLRNDAENERLKSINDILAMINEADSDIEKIQVLEEAIKAAQQMIDKLDVKSPGKAWDFSKEKQMDVYAKNDKIELRPFSNRDRDNYIRIHKQYASSIHDFEK